MGITGALIMLAGAIVYAAGTIAGVLKPEVRRQEFLIAWTLFILGLIFAAVEFIKTIGTYM